MRTETGGPLALHPRNGCGARVDSFFLAELLRCVLAARTESIRPGHCGIAQDLLHWVNDGQMAFFFLVARLEIRRDLDGGPAAER
ncbi:MAG: Na+/H+ antiporter NhaA [Solirubrobacteraceae bacterium]